MYLKKRKERNGKKQEPMRFEKSSFVSAGMCMAGPTGQMPGILDSDNTQSICGQKKQALEDK